MTEKEMELIATKIDIPKINLKNNLSNIKLEEITEKIYEEAIMNVVKAMKEEEPDASEEYLRAFVETFFDLNLTQEYDIRTNEYKLTCIPTFKELNRVTYTPENRKLLDDYAFGNMKK